MSQAKTIKFSNYPKMIQDFADANFNLKVLCSVLLAFSLLALAVIIYLVKKGPVVLALDGSGEVARVESKITDLQIEAAAKKYLHYRYNWNAQDIGDQLKKAEFFVHPPLVPAFQKSMVEVQKYVKEKKVSQRVYPKKIDVDLKEKTLAIVADRITEFDALKAATEMHVYLHFTTDDRTVVNPWGVYIIKESEESAP